MEFEIIRGEKGKNGNLCDLLKVSMDRGDSFFSEKQQMRSMSQHVQMFTERKSNLLFRFLLGESFFWQHYLAFEDNQEVTLTKDAPGRIIEESISPENRLICHRESFLAAEQSIKPVLYNLLNLHYKKTWENLPRRIFFTTGIDYAFHDLTGKGKVFIESDGDYNKIILEKGQHYVIDPDYLIMFSKDMGVKLKSPNEMNPEHEKFIKDHPVYKEAMQGRRWDIGNYILNGIFLVELKGPGTVYADTISRPPHESSNLISRIKNAITSRFS